MGVNTNWKEIFQFFIFTSMWTRGVGDKYLELPGTLLDVVNSLYLNPAGGNCQEIWSLSQVGSNGNSLGLSLLICETRGLGFMALSHLLMH